MLFLLKEVNTLCWQMPNKSLCARFGWDTAGGFTMGPGTQQRGNSTFRDGNQVPGSHL